MTSQPDVERTIKLASVVLDRTEPYRKRVDTAGELIDMAIWRLLVMRESFHDPSNMASMETFAKDSVRLAVYSAASEPGILDLIEVREILGEEKVDGEDEG